MLFIIFKLQMISTQQVVQFHCLQIIRIYKQTINRSHGFHGRSPIFFLQWFFFATLATLLFLDCILILTRNMFLSAPVFTHNMVRFSYGILLPKLFWSTVRKNCSSDWEKLLKFEAESREFSKFLRSLEQFIQTVKGQNNFW